jgi:hypothetical protein
VYAVNLGGSGTDRAEMGVTDVTPRPLALRRRRLGNESGGPGAPSGPMSRPAQVVPRRRRSDFGAVTGHRPPGWLDLDSATWRIALRVLSNA